MQRQDDELDSSTFERRRRTQEIAAEARAAADTLAELVALEQAVESARAAVGRLAAGSRTDRIDDDSLGFLVEHLDASARFVERELAPRRARVEHKLGRASGPDGVREDAFVPELLRRLDQAGYRPREKAKALLEVDRRSTGQLKTAENRVGEQRAAAEKHRLGQQAEFDRRADEIRSRWQQEAAWIPDELRIQLIEGDIATLRRNTLGK